MIGRDSMEVITISIESKARDIAQARAKVIRKNSRFRYLFIPYVLDNHKDPEKSVKAKIIVQKKNQSDKWEDYNSLKLTDMNPEQWFNVDLSSSELDTIINYCLELRKHYAEEGKGELFNSQRVMILTDGEKSEDVDEFIKILKEKQEVKEIVAQIMKDELDIYSVVQFLSLDENNKDFIKEISINDANKMFDNLKTKILNVKYMNDNISNCDETFWQKYFTSNPNILSTIFPSVYQIICEQPFLGGKAIDNKGGKISDYIYEFGTRNSCIIEIKTPCTPLLSNSSYRDSFPPSNELSGSILQIRKQKDKLLKSYNNLKVESLEKGIEFDAYDPKCYLIIGNISELDNVKQSDFELYRSGIKDVEIITFDELIRKMKILSQIE